MLRFVCFFLIICIQDRSAGATSEVCPLPELVPQAAQLHPSPELLDLELKGNGQWPQGGFGMRLYLLKGFLSQHDIDAAQFANLTLSQQQIEKMGAVMNTLHKAYDVNVVDKRVAAEKGIRPIGDARLDGLWVSARNLTSVVLKAKETWSPRRQELLGVIVNRAVEALESPEGKKLSAEYRKAAALGRFSPTHTKNRRVAEGDIKKIVKEYFFKTESEYDDIEFEDIWNFLGDLS